MTVATAIPLASNPVAADPPSIPDWRDASAYAPLAGADPAAIAWEWLRRNARYQSCHAAWRAGGTRGG